MATRRYKISVGEAENDVVEEVGAANNSDAVELTVDLDSTLVNFRGSTRGVSKQEVLDGIEKIKNHIVKSEWPPA